jgi:hypothetical protein
VYLLDTDVYASLQIEVLFDVMIRKLLERVYRLQPGTVIVEMSLNLVFQMMCVIDA